MSIEKNYYISEKSKVKLESSSEESENDDQSEKSESSSSDLYEELKVI